MRSLFDALLVLTSAAVACAHAQHRPSLRKSLAFGPGLPNARYTTSPDPQFTTSLFTPSSDPFDVARAFLDNLVDTGYTIRSDSYTDKRSGVTHVYARQIINGLQVSDGNINLNIKNGKVISYGDTFYRGPASVDDYDTPLVHQQYCQALATEIQSGLQDYLTIPQQTPLGTSELNHYQEQLTILEHIHTSNCDFLKRNIKASSHNLEDPRTAALMFMIAATPSTSLADDLASRFDEYLSQVSLSPSHHLLDNGPHFELHQIPDTVNPVKAHLAYAQVPSGDTTSLKMVWKLEVEMEDNWYDAAVDAFNPSIILSVVDWASDAPFAPIPIPPPNDAKATYMVFPWGMNDPSEGNRSQEAEIVDILASPLGWHSLPASYDPMTRGRLRAIKSPSPNEVVRLTTTAGNNVYAHENWAGRNEWIYNYRPDAGNDMDFNFTYDPQLDSANDNMRVAKSYINATVTQLFYTINMFHDLLYRYGFDEVSGNFQQYNFGRGGRENDAIIANAQDGSGFNNANFMTPPDGQNGRCRMYIWNTATPYRDGDLEAGIVIHEVSHGLSTRLTGGPKDSSCLGWGESGGMGEGWGDFLATTIRSNKVYSDYSMGSWAANDPKGIRYFVYSTEKTVNPSTYEYLDKPNYWGVHAIGEVWAEMLWIVLQKLIAKHGFSDTLFPPAPLPNGTVPEGDFYRTAEYDSNGVRKPLIPKHGNTLIVQLVLDGMKLQPCQPTFFNARDAIIHADELLTGGENACELWQGFAERGLGPDALIVGRTPWGGGIRTDDFKPPLRCRS